MNRPATVLLASALLCAACGQPNSANASALIVGEGDNGREISVDVGQTLRVSLPCSPSTGYSWRMVGDAGPELKLVSSGMATQTSSTLGSPQSQDFVFEGQTGGVKQLRFEYVRPWDTGGAPAKGYALTAKVIG
jgi:inhibitor of cysteine peptidase